MSKISIVESSMVCPAEETPHGCLWLSSLDAKVVTPFRHTPVLYVYHRQEYENDLPLSNFFSSNIMKGALSRVLVPFYPVAGRIKMNVKEGRMELDCNAKGVLFVEAKIGQSLAEMGDFASNTELKKGLVPSCDYTNGFSSFPLLMVQLTQFSCGGVVLGLAIHHQVVDGKAQLHLTTSWARLARGLDLTHLPYHDRKPFLAPRSPPKVSFEELKWEYGPPQGILGDVSQLNVLLETTPTTVSFFKLTKDQIGGLKLKAKMSTKEVIPNYKPSTYEVIAGHVWRCACKARGLAHDQEVRVFLPIDGRSRLTNPPLPHGFTGNVIFYAGCVAKAGEITSNPLGYAASKIHETITRVKDEEYMRSTIDYLESHPDPKSLIRVPQKFMCPNLNINSWAKLPFDEADFGWGKPVFGGHGGIGFEGQSFIIPSTNGDGTVSVAIKLFSSHMDHFKTLFYHLLDSSI